VSQSVRPLQFAANLQATLQTTRPRRYGVSVLVGASLLGLWSLPVRAADVAVLHAEPIAITVEDGSSIGDVTDARKSSLSSATENAPRHLKFDAFGRRFALDLETHADLNSFASQHGSSAIALRGALNGNSSSWVRITQSGTQTRGLIWDGHELYAIEPAGDLPGNDKSAKGTVVFRLSDTKTELGPDSCGAAGTDKEPSGSAYYANFRKEFSAAKNDFPAAAISHRLLLSAMVDASFEQQFSSAEAAADALVARINNIDGIFTAQLGVAITLTDAVSASSAIAARLSAKSAAVNRSFSALASRIYLRAAIWKATRSAFRMSARSAAQVTARR